VRQRCFAEAGALRVATGLAFALWLGAAARSSAQQPPATAASDSALEARVRAALVAARDLPVDSLQVQVSDGVVTVVGSVVCSTCGGAATPPGSGTVQQSLGAVVRAVPGVERVVFRLRYRPE
jgi:osmotically-inducible protein OsmY